MTVRDLQKAVAADLEALFKNDFFKTPEAAPEEEWPDWLKELPRPVPEWRTHRMAAPKAYEQFLPLKTMDNGSIDPEAEDPFPYIIVRADKGGVEGPTNAHKADVILLIGIFDDDPVNQGHRAVLEMIERIQTHYQETPLLAGQFVCQDPFEWALQDEESFPYYFGACQLTFAMQAPRAKWSELT